MKKIKWINVMELMALILCTAIILHDSYMIMFKSYSFTWFGFITFVFVTIQGSILYEKLEQKIKIALKN